MFDSSARFSPAFPVRLLLGFLLLGTLAQPSRSEDKRGGDEEQRAYEWFQTLGYPDVSKAPFIRVYTGYWTRRNGDPRRAVPDHGFLLGDRDGVFKVFTFGMETMALRRSAGKQPHERVGYERISFEDYVRDGLKKLKHRSNDWPWPREPFGHLEYMPRLHFRLVTLAHACARRGHAKLARGVWQELQREISSENDKAPVLDLVKREVGEEAYRQLILGFEDPQRTLADQLAGFRWWRDNFGTDKRVTEAMAILDTMTVQKAPKDRESVAGLIHQLRESEGSNAVRKLVDRGFAAVPQLIAALGDRQFTRSVEMYGMGKGYLREEVATIRVGDFARSILLEISTLQRFNAQDGDALREEVQRWWDEARKQSERDYLIGRVEAAGEYVILPIRRLLQRYPDAAEKAMLRGLEAATKDEARYSFILELETIQSARATAAIVREVKAEEPRRRLLASWLALARGHDDGVRAVIELWPKSKAARDEVAHFLCHCGNLEALQALRKDLADRPRRDRFLVVWSLRDDWSPRFVKKEQLKRQEGWHEAVEALLVSCLLDTGTMEGMIIGIGENHFKNPRICDVAATALAKHYASKYTFNKAGTKASRDRACRVAANTWRREHGLEPLDAPKPNENDEKDVAGDDG